VEVVVPPMAREAEVLVGDRMARPCWRLTFQGLKFEPAITPKAPEEMVRPDPVMSVMAGSAPIWREVRSRVVVAFNLVSKALLKPRPVRESLTTRLVMVEEAELMRMPAAVEVGRMTFTAKVSHRPGWPALAQAEPEVVTTEELSSSRHLEAVKLLRVKLPVIMAVPFSRVEPKTPKVVVGRVVLMPTLPVAPSAQSTGVSREAVDEAILK